MRKLLFLFFSLLFFQLNAAEITRRLLIAQRTDQSINIDGVIDEEAWIYAPIADNFITLEPNPGEASKYETKVRLVYNNQSLYVAAELIDPEPEKIMKILSSRDNTGNASYFSVIIDPYQSGINGFGFSVTAAGVQSDFRITSDGEDDNWDAVWDSQVRITENGWIVEMEIPYSAIRFPDSDVQSWHINFGREVRRVREVSFWNEIDPTIEGFLNQAGILKGIEDIKTPLRLMLTPYISFGGSVDAKTANSFSSGFNGGMDLKYGINDAFTLDMTLIPDFSQVRFDKEVLNLSPFEVQFDENRAFFTEGTELFNKAGLFYSRRIGGRVFDYGVVSDLEDQGYTIDKANQDAQLLNASKLSGRTNNGLGLGVFNAIVGESNVHYSDDEGNEYAAQTNPFTNYNVFVADQQFKNNSFLSFINTNVWRQGTAYDANVTGTEFSFRTKDQNYEFAGSSALSQKYYTDGVDLGYKYRFSLGKVSGKYNYEFRYSEESPGYDINDLGFNRSANERSISVSGRYNEFNPKAEWMNRSSLYVFGNYKRLVQPDVFTDFSLTTGGFIRTSGFIGFGGRLRLEPIQTYDYFEPRTSDFSQFYAFPTNFMLSSFVSTNYNKPLAFNSNLGFRAFGEEGRNTKWVSLEPRVRFNDRVSFSWEYSYRNELNDVGYLSSSIEVEGADDPVIFGKRDRNTIVNELTTRVSFNENMFIRLIGRHYWSKVNYNSYHLLGSEGELIQQEISDRDDEGNKVYDLNFNLLNMDLVYNWRFAPGSDLVFVVKNFASNGQDLYNIRENYFDSVSSIYDYNNNFSMNLKVLYFLDYQRFARKV